MLLVWYHAEGVRGFKAEDSVFIGWTHGTAFSGPLALGAHSTHTDIRTTDHGQHTQIASPTSHRHSEAHIIETLIVGVSGKVCSQKLHTCWRLWQSWVYRHYCNWSPLPLRQVAGDWCSCEAGVQEDQFVVSASSALSSGQRKQICNHLWDLKAHRLPLFEGTTITIKLLNHESLQTWKYTALNFPNTKLCDVKNCCGFQIFTMCTGVSMQVSLVLYGNLILRH